GSQGPAHAFRYRHEHRPHPRGSRQAVRRHPRAYPPDRSQGIAQAAPPDTKRASALLPRRVTHKTPALPGFFLSATFRFLYSSPFADEHDQYAAQAALSILRSCRHGKFSRVFEQGNISRHAMTRNDKLRIGISMLQPFCRSGPLADDRIGGVTQRAGSRSPNETPAIQQLLLRQPHDEVIHAMPSTGIEDLDLALEQP